MASKKRRPPDRGSGAQQPAPENPPAPEAETKKSTKKRIALWVGGMASVVVTALLAAFSTTIGNHLGAKAVSPGEPAGMPARVDSVVMPRSDTFSYVFGDTLNLTDAELGQLNSLNQTDGDYQTWFTSRHAVSGQSIEIQLVVEGNRDHAVRILNIQPVSSCTAPLSGTLFINPSAGGDRSTHLLLDLDSSSVLTAYTGGKDFFNDYTISLNRGEQYTFGIYASTSKSYCHFTLDMTVLDGDKTIHEQVDDKGTPFQVTSTGVTFHAAYVTGVLNHSGARNAFGNSTWIRGDPLALDKP
ncbi:MAG: hypothetical protein HOW97_27360 [Catenulispora sp.]|nr:hypothetical protein [Catenulispora sp.]